MDQWNPRDESDSVASVVPEGAQLVITGEAHLASELPLRLDTEGKEPQSECTRTAESFTPPIGLTVAEIHNVAMGMQWWAISRADQIEYLAKQDDNFLDEVQAVIAIGPTGGIDFITSLLQALVRFERDLPEVIIVLSDSFTVPESSILAMQRRLHGLGIDEVLLNATSQRDLHLAIQMSLFKSQHKQIEMVQVATNLRQTMTTQLQDRVRHELTKVSVRQTDCMTGLFWQTVHRTFEGFPHLDRSIPSKLEIGSQAGPLQIEGQLGAGSFGIVYCVANAREGRCEALKVISKKSLDDMGKIVTLWKEICCHTRLDHENITRLYGCLHGPGHVCLLMEMAGTTSLFRALRMAGNRFSLEGATAILIQLASAVAHCHENRVAHRDLKPENIVLAINTMTIKVCDFGSATPTTKMRNDIVGTMPFIAPEVMAPERPGYWPAPVDMWATGIIMLEMICGIGKLSDFCGWNAQASPEPERYFDLCNFSRRCPDAITDAVTAQLGEPFPELNEVLIQAIKFNPFERMTSAQLLRTNLAELIIGSEASTQYSSTGEGAANHSDGEGDGVHTDQGDPPRELD